MAKPGKGKNGDSKGSVTGRTWADAATEFGSSLVRGIVEVSLRLIDKGHISTFFGLMVVVLLGILAVRIPANEISALPRLISESIQPIFWTILAISATTNMTLILVVKRGRTYYLNEIDRMAEHKKQLELVIDPNRRGSLDVMPKPPQDSEKGKEAGREVEP